MAKWCALDRVKNGRLQAKLKDRIRDGVNQILFFTKNRPNSFQELPLDAF